MHLCDNHVFTLEAIASLWMIPAHHSLPTPYHHKLISYEAKQLTRRQIWLRTTAMEMRHIKTQPTVHRINVRSSLEDIEIEVDSPGSEAGQMTHEFETLSAARLSSASRNSDHMSTIPEQPTLQSDAFSVTTIRLSPVSQRSNVHSTPSINVSDSPKESRQAYREGSPVIYQWWRTVPGLPLVVVFIRRLRFINVLHWFFILMPVLMFFLSLVFHWWRVIRVDRESLKNKKHADELMWNSTITLTRSQVIFWECFVDSPKSFARYTRTHFSFQGQNDNYSFVRPRCHKILSEVRVVHQFHKQADLVSKFNLAFPKSHWLHLNICFSFFCQIISELKRSFAPSSSHYRCSVSYFRSSPNFTIKTKWGYGAQLHGFFPSFSAHPSSFAPSWSITTYRLMTPDSLSSGPKLSAMWRRLTLGRQELSNGSLEYFFWCALSF